MAGYAVCGEMTQLGESALTFSSEDSFSERL